METSGIKILLVDDHPFFLSGLESILNPIDDFIVIGKARNGREAIKFVVDHQPDMIIMDVAMPKLNGIETTKKIMSLYPNMKIIGLSIYSSTRFVKDMILAGAVGYLLKDHAPEKLISTIYKIARGETYVNPRNSKFNFDTAGLNH